MSKKKEQEKPFGAIAEVETDVGVTVYIRPRAGTQNLQMVTYDLDVGPKTAGTSDLKEAKAIARRWAKTLVRQMPEGFLGTVNEKWLLYGDESLTFGDAFHIFEEMELPELKGRYAQCRASDLLALKALIPHDLPIYAWSKKHVKEYIRARRAGGFTTVTPRGTESIRVGVQDATIHDDLNLLGRVVEVVREQLEDGATKALKSGNPVWASKKEGKRKKYWPKKRGGGRTLNPDDYFYAMLAVADEQERINRVGKHMPPGHLKTFLQMLRWDGRRVGAHQALEIRDILFTPEDVKHALRTVDLGVPIPEDWPDHWPYGAILWVPERSMEVGGTEVSIGDKMRQGFVVPMAQRMHEMLKDYIASHPKADIPTAPLFPNGRDPMKPVQYHELYRWWRALERRAGLVHREGQALHGERHKRRSELNGMPEELVQIVCSWAVDDYKVMNAVYLHYEPDEIYACVEMDEGIDGRNAGLQAVMRRLGLLKEDKGRLAERLLEACSADELEEFEAMVKARREQGGQEAA